MDEVPLAVICDPRNRDIVQKRGEDPDRVIDAYIDAINDAIRDRPANMTVAVHMCRGNMGHGMADGGYEAIGERAVRTAQSGRLSSRIRHPRAGDFEPLRFVPKGKRVAIGIMTTKNPEVESADALKRRIEEASRSIDIDQLALCPQCGFSSNAGTGNLPARRGRTKTRPHCGSGRPGLGRQVGRTLPDADHRHSHALLAAAAAGDRFGVAEALRGIPGRQEHGDQLSWTAGVSYHEMGNFELQQETCAKPASPAVSSRRHSAAEVMAAVSKSPSFDICKAVNDGIAGIVARAPGNWAWGRSTLWTKATSPRANAA